MVHIRDITIIKTSHTSTPIVVSIYSDVQNTYEGAVISTNIFVNGKVF